MRTYFQVNKYSISFVCVLLNKIMIGYCWYFDGESIFAHQSYLKDHKTYLLFAVGKINFTFAYK
jgi:hypothetical protein